MQMSSSQPEHDATALAALQAHPATATRELRAGLASRFEPQAAKRDARESRPANDALAVINAHDIPRAVGIISDSLHRLGA